MEAIQATVNKYAFKFLGTETERKIGLFLYEEDVQWASSKELHGLAALTFNEKECAIVMAMIRAAIDPKDNTWLTIHKAVRLLAHFVIYGAERCVDHARFMDREIEDLVRYNSAIHSRSGSIAGAGTDFGEPVRREATSLVALLKDVERIRVTRAANRDSQSLLPQGNSSDYVPPPAPIEYLKPSKEDVFGVVRHDSLGAKFSLSEVPGMYDGRPARYFDNPEDRRNHRATEDALATRNYMAGDLLDLPDEIPEAVGPIPESQDLLKIRRESELEQQLQAQRQQLEELKRMVAQQGPRSQQSQIPNSGNSSAGFSIMQLYDSNSSNGMQNQQGGLNNMNMNMMGGPNMMNNSNSMPMGSSMGGGHSNRSSFSASLGGLPPTPHQRRDSGNNGLMPQQPGIGMNMNNMNMGGSMMMPQSTQIGSSMNMNMNGQMNSMHNMQQQAQGGSMMNGSYNSMGYGGMPQGGADPARRLSGGNQQTQTQGQMGMGWPQGGSLI